MLRQRPGSILAGVVEPFPAAAHGKVRREPDRSDEDDEDERMQQITHGAYCIATRVHASERRGPIPESSSMMRPRR